ncbi:MAG: DUF4136 domain-containing protein [Schleiferiaceae bacterium]|jgi:hypothetical protein|nr:DUF4136 domain-containing protein [Schleiferiaceae bacterium]
MRKLYTSLFILAFSAILLTGCESAMTVTSDYDREVDFTQYKTFQLLPWDENLGDLVSRNSQSIIDNAIKDVLNRYGYVLVEKNADLVVSTYVHVDEKEGVTAYNNYYGPTGYYGGWGYGYGYGYGVGVGMSTTTYSEYTYQVGSLIIDFYDQQEKKLVWQGIGSDELSDNPKKVQNKIPSYVRQVLYDFPKVKQK